MKLFPRSLW